MAIRSYLDYTPELGEGVFVDDSAVVTGRVTIGANSSIWPMTSVRGDVHTITIGARSNIQDGTVIHITAPESHGGEGFPTSVGDDVTVGHKAILHGCSIGNRVLIGMGAVIMDGVTIEDNVMVAGGALVSPGKTLESGGLYVGSPAKRARDLKQEELDFLGYSAEHYVKLKDRHIKSSKAIG